MHLMADARRQDAGLPKERADLYARIQHKIGNTPLSRVTVIPVPNGCRIYLKEEYRNPTGSHYDRQTLPLLRRLEAAGDIIPGRTTLWETTTGSSGASFAWMCRTLGYRAVVMIPKNMPAARIHQIESYGAEVKLSGEAYIDGLVADLRKQWATERHKPDTCFPNHAMVSSDWAWKPMEVLGEEILSQFAAAEGGTRPDCFVTALGNGISAMGVGTALKNAGALVYGMEPIESPTVYYKFFPDRYKRKFGSDQPRFSSHLIYGTGPGAKIIFPNIEAIAPKLEDVFHPTKNDVMSIRDRLMFEELQLVGNSSAACLWACLKLAEEKRNVTIVTIMYDAAWRYLPFERVK